MSQVCRAEKFEHKGRRDGRTNLLEQGLMSDLESDFCHQEAMCDEDMPALFQYFTKVSLLLSSTIPPSFFPPSPRFHLPLRHASVSCQEALCDEESGGLDLKDPNRPRFTLQELRDVLHERNELKAKVFLLQEELAYYKRCSSAKMFPSLCTILMYRMLIILTLIYSLTYSLIAVMKRKATQLLPALLLHLN